MSNCNVGQCVSGVTVEWQRVKWKKSPKAWYQPSGKCKEVCSCHITTNVPLKSFAVSKYTQLVTKHSQVVFLSMNISGTVIQETNQDVLKLTGCLEAIFKFISMTSIYFKYIMCCGCCRRHMFHLGKQSQRQHGLIQTRCPGSGH